MDHRKNCTLGMVATSGLHVRTAQSPAEPVRKDAPESPALGVPKPPHSLAGVSRSSPGQAQPLLPPKQPARPLLQKLLRSCQSSALLAERTSEECAGASWACPREQFVSLKEVQRDAPKPCFRFNGARLAPRPPRKGLHICSLVPPLTCWHLGRLQGGGAWPKPRS